MKKQKKNKYTNPYNYKHHPSHYETPKGESVTIPGEAYTIQELYMRSMGGLLENFQQRGQYDGDPTFDDYDLSKIANLDFTELSEIQIELLQEEINKFNDSQKKKDKGTEDEKTETSENEENDSLEEPKSKA